jgi:hypothetical protein
MWAMMMVVVEDDDEEEENEDDGNWGAFLLSPFSFSIVSTSLLIEVRKTEFKMENGFVLISIGLAFDRERAEGEMQMELSGRKGQSASKKTFDHATALVRISERVFKITKDAVGGMATSRANGWTCRDPSAILLCVNSIWYTLSLTHIVCSKQVMMMTEVMLRR